MENYVRVAKGFDILTNSLAGTAVEILDQNGTRRRTACTAWSNGRPR